MLAKRGKEIWMGNFLGLVMTEMTVTWSSFPRRGELVYRGGEQHLLLRSGMEVDIRVTSRNLRDLDKAGGAYDTMTAK